MSDCRKNHFHRKDEFTAYHCPIHQYGTTQGEYCSTTTSCNDGTHCSLHCRHHGRNITTCPHLLTCPSRTGVGIYCLRQCRNRCNIEMFSYLGRMGGQPSCPCDCPCECERTSEQRASSTLIASRANGY